MKNYTQRTPYKDGMQKQTKEEINDHIEIDHEGIQSPKNWALELLP